MTLNLHDGTDHDGLFDVQGSIFNAMAALDTARLTTVPTEVLAALAAIKLLPTTLDMALVDESIPSAVSSWQSAGDSLAAQLAETCQNILREMVAADATQPEDSLRYALEYLIDFMAAGGYYVDASTIGFTLTPAAGNDADLVIAYTSRRGDGQVSQFCYAETIDVEVVAESATSPTLSLLGDAAVSNRLSQAWPGGSGVRLRLTATDAASSLLTNGDFEDATIDNVPDEWIVHVGSPGTSVSLTDPEQQTIAISGTPTGGSYVLVWTNAAGLTYATTHLPYAASASEVQEALRLIPGLDLVTVSATGTSPDYTHTVVFHGTPGDPGQLTSVNHLTGGTTPTIAHATTVAGDAGAYKGRALAIAGDGAELTALYHELYLTEETVYFLHCRVRRGPTGTTTTTSTSTTTTGSPVNQVRIALVAEIGGAVTLDPAGNANSTTIDVAGLSGSAHTSVWFAFALKKDQAQPVYLEIAVTGPLESGLTFYVDEVAVVQGTQLYVGGPYVAAFSGNTEVVNGDAWTLQVSNNRGGEIQEWYHRCFNLAALGLQLPISGSTNIPDTLIA